MPPTTLRLAALAYLLALAPMARAGPPTADAARTRDLVVETNPYLIGQAPDWLDRTHVVWHDPFGRDEDGDGETNVYRSTLDGGEKVCLTCGLDGPNQVAVVQPHGKWILFHSWSGHQVTIGGPGFGGLGSDLWIVTRDGQQRTNLTNSTDFHDNFHAYWSPDGKYVVWTSLNWNKDEGGDGKSDVRVARFDPSGPRLVDEHVVRPGNGHWYETQWWAPDGSGFLYTETADTAVNPELYFCRLKNPARGACQPVRLTQDPAWDEQAIFTHDMKRVVFMSSRNLPGAHNDWSKVAELLELPADFDHVLILLVFSDSYLQPVFQQPTDLYALDLRWNAGRTRFKPGAVRRLTETGKDGWVIPEFAFDPTGHRLLWTQNRFPDGVRVDQSCVVRQIRDAFIARLSGVHEILQIPLGIQDDIRTQAAALLAPPRSYPFAGRGCGGDTPPSQRGFAQETKIAHFVDR